jgi:leucyl-tRNA synthetase
MSVSLNKRVYPFKAVEQKWKNNDADKQNPIEKSKYLLEMLPYPSGKIHIGHIRNYTIVEILKRFYELKGFKVFRPMGWDAFGLPAENAAIANNSHPKTWTEENIKNMKKSLQNVGFWYDWNAELATCDVSYYKHQQKIFLKFYENNLVYRKKDYVNWDPVDLTVLANEQVSKDGLSWRSGAKVEKKEIEQWFCNISKYADELLDDLQTLTQWPDKIKIMQHNWIGKSQGIEFNFTSSCDLLENEFKCFTTQPQTIYGVTFIAISIESQLIKKIKQNTAAYEKYININNINNYDPLRNNKFSDFCIGYVYNDFNKKNIPIMIADYVIADYGSGIVMGVPTADERDINFAGPYEEIEKISIYDENLKLINSSELNGKTIEEAQEYMFNNMKNIIYYKLRDWCISRQRYWGCPIPFIYCQKCGLTPLREEDLPIMLPEKISFIGKGNPLESDESWLYTTCHKCGGKAHRETDTMDTFFDSSWYFLRYPCVDNISEPFDNRISEINTYVGGAEHATLHLLYSRFFIKAFRDMGMLSYSEPFQELINQGMVLHESYQGKDTLNYYYPEEVDLENLKHIKTQEDIVINPPTKMSKSLKNVIEPDYIINVYGADALKMFIVSDTPIDKDLLWNTNALIGCNKFLNRIWVLTAEIKEKSENNMEEDSLLNAKIEHEIYKINKALDNRWLNLYIAHVRMLFNLIEENISKISRKQALEIFKKFLVCFWLVASNLCYECYEILFNKNIIEENWREGIAMHESSTASIVIAINGKRSREIIVNDMDESFVLNEALKFIKDKYIKYIYVKGKVINFII